MSEAMRLGGHLPAAAFSILSLSVGAVLPEPDVWVEDGWAPQAASSLSFLLPSFSLAPIMLA